MRNATNPLALREIATELDHCKMAFPAAWLLFNLVVGMVVMPWREKQHRVSQTAGKRQLDLNLSSVRLEVQKVFPRLLIEVFSSQMRSYTKLSFNA